MAHGSMVRHCGPMAALSDAVDDMTSTSQIPPSHSKMQLVAFSVIAALVAAFAAGSSAAMALPVWAMFIGWIAFFTRGPSLSNGLWNTVCVLAGITLGVLAALCIGTLAPILGAAALPVAVFIAAMIVMSLRLVKHVDNVLCYFLGLVAYFASHITPTLESITSVIELGGAVVLGSVAGGIAFLGQRRVTKA